MNTELNKPNFLHKEIIFRHCSLQIRQNIYSIGIFRAPKVTQFIVKSIKKNRKKSHFESLPFLYWSIFSECKGVSRASSDSIIYFNKK